MNRKRGAGDNFEVRKKDTENDWFIRFPWLIHDGDNHVFRCWTCVHAKARIVFVTGKDANKLKKDDLVKHEMSADHNRPALLPQQQLAFATARVTANDHAKSAIIAQLSTVLIQAKHCLPTVKNAALVELQVLNVSTIYPVYMYFLENRGCPYGHMLVTHWSKKAQSLNLCGEPKHASGSW